jgi:rare lipoprotein A
VRLHPTLHGRGLALAGLAAWTITAASAYAAPAPVSGGAHAPKAQIQLSTAGEPQKVRYGGPVRIAGSVTPATPGRSVRLEHAVRGARFLTVATTHTAKGGSYNFTVRARRSGFYRVASAGATASATRSVTVVGVVKGRSRRHVLGMRGVRVRGRLLPRRRGRVVRLELRTHAGWRIVGRTRTRRAGSFRATFRPGRAGSYRLRVRFPGDRYAAAASRALRRVNVYRAGSASWYGPGLYGNHLGCGGRLSPGTLGVANRSLPCGTRVVFRYRGRSVTVPVIDRGPFSAGREWDLTAATKHRLGFGSTGTVWSTR